MSAEDWSRRYSANRITIATTRTKISRVRASASDWLFGGWKLNVRNTGLKNDGEMARPTTTTQSAHVMMTFKRLTLRRRYRRIWTTRNESAARPPRILSAGIGGYVLGAPTPGRQRSRGRM